MKESAIQKSVMNLLQIYENMGKMVCARTNSGKVQISRKNGSTGWMSTGKRGFPDIVCLCQGQFIGLEVKTESGTLSKDQIRMKKMILLCGGRYYIVRSANDVKEIVDNILKGG